MKLWTDSQHDFFAAKEYPPAICAIFCYFGIFIFISICLQK